MHRKYQGEGLSPRMIEVRNRVFWTAYTIEKYVISFDQVSHRMLIKTGALVFFMGDRFLYLMRMLTPRCRSTFLV
jgi:hypothetical protein